MVNSKVARRYAKSLMLLSNERGTTPRVYGEMLMIKNTSVESREFGVFLRSPVIKKDKKIDVINLVFGGVFSDEVNGFIRIITKNNREALLEEIAQAYVEIYLEQQNIVRAEVVSAVAIDSGLRTRIRETLQRLSSAEIELTEQVDAEIIGGLILRIGDQQYDASVARNIKKLHQNFNTKDYQSNI